MARYARRATRTARRWSDRTAQDAFRAKLVTVLNAPASRRDSTAGIDRDTLAVGPPLYGSHHSGEQTVKPESGGWITTLNLEVRRRVAAALGTRYVQVEQEFLMARAWEQVGAIREANRLLAAAELATAAAIASRTKNINPLNATDLILTSGADGGAHRHAQGVPAKGWRRTPDAGTGAARDEELPKGMPTTAYARLTRRGGALGRRIKRAVGSPTMGVSLIEFRVAPLRRMANADAGEPGARADRSAGAAISPHGRCRGQPGLSVALRWRRPAAGTDHEAPQFNVPMAEEMLARWPEWAIPGISGLPDDSVIVARDEPRIRRRTPGRAQSRIQPRTVVARVPHRSARHRVCPVLADGGQ